MKCGAAALILGVLSPLLLSPFTRANVPDSPGSPYRGIVDRNIFGLKPPPPPLRPEDIKQPAPEIYLSGITTILGKKQVLLKVPAKPPQRPKEESYILTEGQSEGEIQVLTIDEVGGTVQVNNHGTPQTLDFVHNGLKPSGGPPAPIAQPTIPAAALPPLPAAAMRQIPRPLRTTPSPENERASANPAAAPNSPAPGYGAPAVTVGPPSATLSFNQRGPGFTAAPDPGVSLEEQTLLIEAQRAKLLEEGNIEEANMFPPTDLTPAQGQPLLPQ